jgi:hypothetical protein
LWQACGLEKGLSEAHIYGMTKRLMALAALITLSGCGGFDEGAERLKCQKSNLEEPKVEECVKAARLAYDDQVRAAKSQAKNP